MDERSSRLLLATDNGIVFKYNKCLSCINAKPVTTIFPGNWDDPTIWSNGKVPDAKTMVVVKHPLTVTKNGSCMNLKVTGPGGIVTINTGIDLKIAGEKIPGQ